jgi:hypothetical protein
MMNMSGFNRKVLSEVMMTTLILLQLMSLAVKTWITAFSPPFPISNTPWVSCHEFVSTIPASRINRSTFSRCLLGMFVIRSSSLRTYSS